MKFKKHLKEIKAVGIKDWIWFVIYLKRNKLNKKGRFHKHKAHVIDTILEDYQLD